MIFVLTHTNFIRFFSENFCSFIISLYTYTHEHTHTNVVPESRWVANKRTTISTVSFFYVRALFHSFYSFPFPLLYDMDRTQNKKFCVSFDTYTHTTHLLWQKRFFCSFSCSVSEKRKADFSSFLLSSFLIRTHKKMVHVLLFKSLPYVFLRYMIEFKPCPTNVLVHLLIFVSFFVCKSYSPLFCHTKLKPNDLHITNSSTKFLCICFCTLTHEGDKTVPQWLNFTKNHENLYRVILLFVCKLNGDDLCELSVVRTVVSR